MVVLLILQFVLGWMEYIVLYNDVCIYVDFAYIFDVLETVLKVLCYYIENYLYVLFGCGGNRD